MVRELSCAGAGGPISPRSRSTWANWPDLVFADIFMPELDGTAPVRSLKKELPNPYGILVSAQSENLCEELAKGGAFAFIPKIDLTIEALVQVLRQERLG